MNALQRRKAAVACGALAVLCMAGCGAQEDIGITNAADTKVTVRIGDEDLGELSPNGGVILLGPAECYPGPIIVTYGRRSVVEVEGPICPGQTLAVGNATVRIIETTTSG